MNVFLSVQLLSDDNLLDEVTPASNLLVLNLKNLPEGQQVWFEGPRVQLKSLLDLQRTIQVRRHPVLLSGSLASPRFFVVCFWFI